jgi:hypothetical protein
MIDIDGKPFSTAVIGGVGPSRSPSILYRRNLTGEQYGSGQLPVTPTALFAGSTGTVNLCGSDAAAELKAFGYDQGTRQPLVFILARTASICCGVSVRSPSKRSMR